MVVHVMDSPAGAAMRVQIDGMIRVLDPIDQDAVDANDQPVMRLIASLHEALDAARTIEQRRPDEPAYKGVSLVRS